MSETSTGAAADPISFEELFVAAWPRLYRTAYGVAGDRGVAEDALQAAFARAYASWRRIGRLEHPEAYLRRMVVHEVLDQRRRGWWRRERVVAEPADQRGTPSPADRTDELVTSRDALWGTVRRLPPRQRAVIVLRYYEDLSEREIAEVLGCSTGTVKSQASAALTTLRRLAADATTGDLR